ncbi:UDP-glycosyltransferase [Arachis hypogaea]|nr:UDP-glycosyltransferase [Arachis hypogaea]
MCEAHILVIPFPAQGHVIPLMKLSHQLVKHGIKVTFVNIDFVHNQIMKSSLGEGVADHNNNNKDAMIELVSIPDGLEDGDNRSLLLGKLTESTCKVMPKKLEMLIEDINKSNNNNNNNNGNKISCLVIDENFGWGIEVAKKMGIRAVAFWPASASLLALHFNIQKLLDDGLIVANDGTPAKDEAIQLGPMMPIKTREFPWACLGDKNTQHTVFNLTKRNNISVKLADWIICNTNYDYEPATFDFAPQIIPIGPLLATNNHVGSFWPEDSSCLNWLDQQETNSVIYVAFGSVTIFDHSQLQELALGLELSNRPFLLVIRADINNGKNQSFLKEFEERVFPFGKVVQWAPQEKVLSHPSIACFISHCGWNSTMEGWIETCSNGWNYNN